MRPFATDRLKANLLSKKSLLLLIIFCIICVLAVTVIKFIQNNSVNKYNVQENFFFTEFDMQDPSSDVFVVIDNELFVKKLDNSIPRKIKTFKETVDFFDKIGDKNDIYIGLDEHPALGSDPSLSELSKSFREEWIIRVDSMKVEQVKPGTIKETVHKEYFLQPSESEESYYTQEVATGGAKIMYWNKKTNEVKQLGFLKNMILKTQVCEVSIEDGTNCDGSHHPYCFIPSPDKTLLLTSTNCEKPTEIPQTNMSTIQGGGLGTDVAVITPDGQKIFDKNFYEYGNNYEWVKGAQNVLTDGYDFYQIYASKTGDSAVIKYEGLPRLHGYLRFLNSKNNSYTLSSHNQYPSDAIIVYTDSLKHPYSNWIRLGEDNNLFEGIKPNFVYRLSNNHSKILYYNTYADSYGEGQKNYYYSPDIQVFDIDSRLNATIAMFKTVKPMNDNNFYMVIR